MSESFAIITPSYRGDFSAVLELCASIDAYVADDFQHFLVIPRSDLKFFAPLRSSRRLVITKEELLSDVQFRKLPIPTRIPFFQNEFRFKEQWYQPRLGRRSGWLIQQLIKLSSPQITSKEICLFIDSDIVLVRPFSIREMMTGRRLHLNVHSRGAHLATHRNWLKSAAALLHTELPSNLDINFIGPFVPWSNAIAAALQFHLATVNEIDWRLAVAREKTVSEYILYGLFAQEIAKAGDQLIFKDLSSFTHTVWVESDLTRIDHYIAGLSWEHAAVCLQSTLPLTPPERRNLIDAMKRKRDEDLQAKNETSSL